jgi:nucleotide-binding universal stress UspA family protein
MVAIRKSNEEGHRRKFLVVVDDTPECDRAIVYAAKRAARTSGVVTLLFIIARGDFQHWLGVEDIMRAEAHQEAEATLGKSSATGSLSRPHGTGNGYPGRHHE